MKAKLDGFLIDPFQKMVHQVTTDDDINAWHKLLDCECFTRFCPEPEVDVFVDDNGLYREPNYPYFSWQGYPEQISGYGLVLTHNQVGESLSSQLRLGDFVYKIQFEEWESRLNPEDYFEQMSRVYPVRGDFGLGKAEVHICSICQVPYQGFGNNARPFNDGRCCDGCNKRVVIPMRMARMQKGQAPYGD